MLVYISRRLLQMIPVVLGVTIIIFFVLRVSGDPVSLMLPEDAPQAQIEALRVHLGLDQPLTVQYFRFLGQLIQGDFGESIRYTGQDVFQIVVERLPATLQLAFFSIVIGILVSVPAGILAALNRGRWPDYVASAFAALGEALPNFWLGIMLVLIFSVSLGWTPVSGRGTIWHLILPAITLGTALAAILTRLMRSSLLEVLGQDYVRTARAKGISPRSVLFKHALRNGMIAYITVLGLQFASLMAGAVVTEQVFSWPGIGLLAIQAINSRDMAIVQAVVIIASLIVMVANLLVDLVYAAIDPRIEYS